MIELCDAIQNAVSTQSTEPLHLVDPRTQRTYVLLPVEVYEQLVFFAEEGDLDTDIDSRQVAALIERNMAELDADDPALESYQQERKGA